MTKMAKKCREMQKHPQNAVTRYAHIIKLKEIVMFALPPFILKLTIVECYL